jgi:MarR-like DNA-binding transcriptional regulator SgrR of sgrS sRNA
VQAWEPGKRAAFAANDDYWGGRPYLDTIEIEMGRSLRDQALDLELNKADVIEMTPADLRRAQQSGRKVWTSAPVDLIALVFDAAIDERVREAVAMSIDRAAIQSVLLQRQGASTHALLPQWVTGYSFLFADQRDHRITPRASAPMTLSYDPQDTILRAISERIAVNAREVNVTIRPVASSATAGAKLTRVHIPTPDAGDALSSISAALGTAQPKATTPYGTERAILQDGRITPLFHLSQIYGLSPRVRNWSATRWGSLRLDSVWLAQDKSRP